MSSAQMYKDAAVTLWKAYHYALQGYADADDIKRWIELGSVAVQTSQILMRSTRLSLSDKQKLQSAVGLLQ